MRPVVLIAVVVASATAGLLIARAPDDKSTPPPPPTVGRDPATAELPPASLVGQKVRVYFSLSDDLPSLVPQGGKLRVNHNGKLSQIAGKVLDVEAGWIALEHEERPGRASLWIPSTSVGYIIVDEADGEAAVQQ